MNITRKHLLVVRALRDGDKRAEELPNGFGKCDEVECAKGSTLRDLQKEGYIRHRGGGRYTLTEKAMISLLWGRYR